MTCHECRKQVALTEDEQAMPPAAREHLAGCAGCQQAVREDETLRALLHGLAEGEPAPQTLREQVHEMVRLRSTGGARSRWRWIVRVAAVLLLAVAGYGLKWYHSQRTLSPNRLAREFVSDHLHYSPGREQIVSESAGDVEKWFQGRVDFPVRVPSVPIATLQDARVCEIAGRKAALVHYRRKPDETLISLFVTEAPQAFGRQTPSEPLLTSYGGFNATVWSQRGLVYSLVGTLDDSSLRQIAESVRQQER